MTSILGKDQRTLLKELLMRRRQELERRVASHQGAQGRVAHAREVLLEDSDDAPQRDADREVDLARSDAELLELSAIGAALARIDELHFGRCLGCGEAIAFDRLRIEPWALRCVACEAAREGKVAAPRL